MNFMRKLLQQSGKDAFAWSLAPLRLIVGYGFLAHGLAKLGRGLEAFPAIVTQMGLPMPHLLGLATIAVEIVGGAAVLAGFLTRIACLPMIVILVVAIFTVHLPYGFSSIKLIAVTNAGPQFGPPGYETALLYVACLAALNLGGSGPLSVDGVLARRSNLDIGGVRLKHRVP